MTQGAVEMLHLENEAGYFLYLEADVIKLFCEYRCFPN